MKLRFTPRATQDLTDIAEYIRLDNPIAALRVRDAILDSLNLLTSFPALGTRQSSPGIFRVVTRKYNYIVYYSVNRVAREITVLAIQHPARQRPN